MILKMNIQAFLVLIIMGNFAGAKCRSSIHKPSQNLSADNIQKFSDFKQNWNLTDLKARKGLANFLEEKMDKYLEWIRENNLDPSPPSQLNYDLSIFEPNLNLTLKMCDEHVVGIADPSNTLLLLVGVEPPPVSTFSILYATMGDIEFHGNYNAEGIINSGTPLEGNGSWIITSKEGIIEHASYVYEITPDGFVNITSGSSLHSLLVMEDAEIYFDNLWDGIDDEGVKLIQDNIREAYRNQQVSYETRKPTRQILYQFLTDVFSKTPLDDIIAES